MRAWIAALAVWAVALAGAAPAAAADYYVSSTGNDASAGTSPAAAWRTLARASAAALAAGDRLLLQGGATFAAPLTVDTTDGGTAAAPITITSYGTGHAIIAAASGNAVVVYNRAAVRIAALTVVGPRTAGTNGLVFYTDAPASAPLDGITVDDVDVSGFGQDGLQIGSWGGPGFSNVRLTHVSAHDNGRTGVLTFADRPNLHRNVYVGNSAAFDNRGIAGAAGNTGSGIVLGAVDGGVVERSVAHDNGAAATATEGPVGIWAYDSAHLTIHHNESYANHTAGPADGGGFDLDQNVTDSVMEFNYSHDNDGAGFLLAHGSTTDGHRNNIVRFNISQNDGRRNGYGAIEIWGRTLNASIYQNTVFVGAAPTGTPSAVRIHNAGAAGARAANVRVVNNILMTRGSAALATVSVDQLAAAPVLFAGNDYAAGTFSITWGSTVVTSLPLFRSMGQEQLNGAAVGLSGDPGLIAAGTGPAFGDATRLETLDAYRLTSSAAAIDKGVSLAAVGLAATTDFFGASIDASAADIGAADRAANALPAPPAAGDSGSGGTAGTGSTLPSASADIVLRASDLPLIAGNWALVTDAGTYGGVRLQNANRDAAKVAAPLATPADVAEFTFAAPAGVPYRLWIRARAERDSYNNDSAYVQFSDSVDAGGRDAFRIGTTSATTFVLEDCSGCGVAGWGWQDNGYGLNTLGQAIAFATSGQHRVRIQPREDGLGIDELILSPVRYFTTPPGPARNDGLVAAAAAPDVVLWAADQPRLSGNWSMVADATAAGGKRVQNANRNIAKLATASSAPMDFVELTFTAEAGVPYRLWLRGLAQGDSYANDSVFVQFSGSVDAAGVPVSRIGTTDSTIVVLEDCSGCGVAGWGWQDNGYGKGVLGPAVYFATSGPQTLRIQAREDGFGFDQVILSSKAWFTTPPGPPTRDTTIEPRP